jgi:hypothetical protein
MSILCPKLLGVLPLYSSRPLTLHLLALPCPYIFIFGHEPHILILSWGGGSSGSLYYCGASSMWL